MANTTQAHGVRGPFTPEHDASREAAARKVEDLSFKLHNLAEVVKLAAFAAEARRTLAAIYSLSLILPEVGLNIVQCVNAPDAWRNMHDNAGEVLSFIADELESVRADFEEARAALARLSSPSEADSVTVTKGGAA